MKIYFAGDGGECVLAKQENVLKSYYYTKSQKNIKIKNMLLDSGGYTAFTKGVTISVDDYINFIYKNKQNIRHYFVLDDIKDYKKTLKNQKYMERKGLKPIPCYHANEPLSVLDSYCTNYDYVAIGGLVPYSKKKKKLKQILDSCFSVIKEHFPIKVHGLGMTTKKILETYPFYSVDSTSWLIGASLGRVTNYDKSKVSLLTKCAYKDKNNEKLYRKRFQYMIKEQLKLEKYITKLWEKRGIKW